MKNLYQFHVLFTILIKHYYFFEMEKYQAEDYIIDAELRIV